MDERRPVRFVDLLRKLVGAEIDFVIVGGVAAVLEGAPVSTFDLDVVYATTPGNVRRLSRLLEELQASYVDLAGRRIEPDAGQLRGGGHHLLRTSLGRLDLLATIGDGRGYDSLLDRAPERSLHGMRVRVLGLESLIAAKEAANRPKDRAVLPLLRETLALRESRSERD